MRRERNNLYSTESVEATAEDLKAGRQGGWNQIILANIILKNYLK